MPSSQQVDHHTTATPSWRGLPATLLVFALIRCAVVAAGWTAPLDKSKPGVWWSPIPLARWDAGHYGCILTQGYPANNPTAEQIAFFPGFPMASWPLRHVLHPDLAMVVTANIASFGAVIFLYLWARRYRGPRVAFWVVLLIAVYPPAMFLSAAYADALLLLCTCAVLWLLSSGRLYPAACVTAIATLTRPTGVALAVVVSLWAFFATPHLSIYQRLRRACLAGLISGAGCLAYQGYLWHHYGRPDAFFATQNNWAYKRDVPNPLTRIVTLKPVLQPGLTPIKYLLRGQFEKFRDPLATWNPMFNLIILGIAIAGLIRPGPLPRVLFLLPILVFLMGYLPDPYRGGRLVGIARYHLIAVPCFLAVANWMCTRWPSVLRYGLVLGLFALEIMYIRGFANWQYVG